VQRRGRVRVTAWSGVDIRASFRKMNLVDELHAITRALSAQGVPYAVFEASDDR
jgi:hypothetical protein